MVTTPRDAPARAGPGGGNNGDIAAGAFDLTEHLPSGPGPFFLRFTALDQGVEGALDRVFLNVELP